MVRPYIFENFGKRIQTAQELSDEELKQVTGGASIDCSLPENATHIKCIKTKFPRYEDKFINVDKKYPGIY